MAGTRYAVGNTWLRARASRIMTGPGGTESCHSAPARSGRALTADQLAVPVLRQLAAMVHKEAARTGELVSLARDHPERQLLVGEVGAGQLQRLCDVIRVDVNRAGGLVHPAGLQLLQAVLGDFLVCLARAVIVSGHLGPAPPPSSCASV